MEQFENKLVYITGGSSGIGLATSRLFASLGAHVAIFARNPEKLEGARQDIERHRSSPAQKISSMSVDVSDNADVQMRMKQALQEIGIPDIVIANAGVGYADRFENIPYEEFDSLIHTNVYGVRNTIAALLPALKERGGRIVIVSSVAGLMGMYGYTAYGTSKFALVGFAECLRAELKPLGIHVTLVCPPEVDTPFVPHEAERLPAESRFIKNFGGLLQPEQVARAIVKGVRKRRFLVMPGMLARALHLNHRLTNGWATRFSSDLLVKIIRRLN